MIDKLEIEGYVLFYTENEEYLDETGYTDLLCYSKWFKKLSDAERKQKSLDKPNKWIIKKVHIYYTTMDMNQDYRERDGGIV